MIAGLGRRSTASGLVVVAAIAVAVASARGYAGGWNDGSRLATVESLVDHHTLAIDRSIFVEVPPPGAAPPPYAADDVLLATRGTLDKIHVGGAFYSDKPPVPALIMAAQYQILQWTTGLVARVRPDRFCYWMTLGSSGLAYVVAVWCVFGFGRPLRLPLSRRVALATSFGLATLAPAYARHVNAHILLLAVGAALLLGLLTLAGRPGEATARWPILGLGTLAGFAYTIDLGAGPPLFVATSVLLAHRWRRPSVVMTCAAGAAPWIALHHAITYAIGGTLRPLASVTEYTQWPGSPFTPADLTGAWNHPGIKHFLRYAAALLLGGRGFVGHDLPLLLLGPALVILARRRPRELPEIALATAWLVSTWLLYAAASTNYSGIAASIRWFVPLLAPAYLVLAALLRDRPSMRYDFAVLSAWGALVSALVWVQGPWMREPIPAYWFLQAAALLSWVACRVIVSRG